MNEIDNHYFNSLGSYDWEKNLITVNCNRDDLLIKDGMEANDEGRKNTSVFVHEYIHFLQNFSTAFGSLIFCDFTSALIKIGASSSSYKEIINSPLFKSKISSQSFLNGLELRERAKSRVSKYSESYIYKSKSLSDLKFVTPNDNFLTLTNERLTVQLGRKVIKEHMAHIATQLFLKKTDEEIHFDNKNFGGFMVEEIEFSNQPEYWILFEFFYQQKVYKNIANGILHLMQICLATHQPEFPLKHFLEWCVSANPKSHINLIDIVEDWLNKSNILEYCRNCLNASIQYCNDVLILTDKGKHENHLLQFANNISSYILKNITTTSGGMTQFLPTDDLYNLNYWSAKADNFGTGMVKYLDTTMIHGNSNHCEKMEESFLFLISSSFALNKILKNQKSICPFLEDIPICYAECKGEENCKTNPFEMIKNREDEKQCVFANGVLLLGLRDRVVFE
jgi:hypothetical protein